MTSPYCERCQYTLTDYDLDNNDRLLCVACETEAQVTGTFFIGFTDVSQGEGLHYVLGKLEGSTFDFHFHDGRPVVTAVIEDTHHNDGIRVYVEDADEFREYEWADVSHVVYV